MRPSTELASLATVSDRRSHSNLLKSKHRNWSVSFLLFELLYTDQDIIVPRSPSRLACSKPAGNPYPKPTIARPRTSPRESLHLCQIIARNGECNLYGDALTSFLLLQVHVHHHVLGNLERQSICIDACGSRITPPHYETIREPYKHGCKA